nr:type IV secretory system conjugative DNA transfer family protein [Nitrosomonas nitrosa]
MSQSAAQEAQAARARTIDPMAGFAAGAALEPYRLKPRGFRLGRIHPDHRAAAFEAGIMDDRHVFIVAGNRAGKGRSLGIPNALHWEGPLFFIDPKGEAASICGMRRGTREDAKGTGTSVRNFLGQKVAILDPFGETKGPARAYLKRYNPLSDIDMGLGGGVRTIRAVVSSIVVPDGESGKHFSETAETLLAGIIEAVKLQEPVHLQTLARCREILLEGFEALQDYLEKTPSSPGKLAREAWTVMDEVGEDEWGSHRSTMSRNLKWLAEPDMLDHLDVSEFSLRRAVIEGWSVFVVIPPLLVSDYRAWLRLTVRIALDAKASQGTNQKGPQTLFFLDEFGSALGHFQLIEDAAGHMAGYGIKLVPIIQNIGQVQKLYAKNWETFLGNAGAIIAWGLNDKETEVYLADRLGHVMIEEASQGTSSSWSAGGMQGGASSNITRQQRPVRFPNEIHEQGARESMRAFVIPAAGKAFTVLRQNYDEVDTGNAIFDSPDFISGWEGSHGRRLRW